MCGCTSVLFCGPTVHASPRRQNQFASELVSQLILWFLGRNLIRRWLFQKRYLAYGTMHACWSIFLGLRLSAAILFHLDE